MAEKINIAEILKDCPPGMELDCSMWNNVVFDHIDATSNYPIYIKKMGGELEYLTEDGHFNFDCDAKCVIFPKGKTTWEGFVPPYKFKDGDILFAKSVHDWIFIYKESGNDVDLYKYVSIPHNCSYKFITYDDNPICHKKEVSEIRLATEEEKKKLFDAIKENSYKWNPENKTLEKLPKFKVGDKIRHKINNEDIIYEISAVYDNFYGLVDYAFMLDMKYQDSYELVPTKFDITTLVPFESRVLVRDNNQQKWSPAMWGYYDCDSQDYPYKLSRCICLHTPIGVAARYCIPYEGNEHLLGTTNDCEEYYKNWE